MNGKAHKEGLIGRHPNYLGDTAVVVEAVLDSELSDAQLKKTMLAKRKY